MARFTSLVVFIIYLVITSSKPMARIYNTHGTLHQFGGTVHFFGGNAIKAHGTDIQV